jgi:hypothetical protein
MKGTELNAAVALTEKPCSHLYPYSVCVRAFIKKDKERLPLHENLKSFSQSPGTGLLLPL